MNTRKHIRELRLETPPEKVFALLHTPSAIRGWWGVARAIVIPKVDGIWVAAWGADEDSPDYMGMYHIRVFDPPRRIVLDKMVYHAKTGPLPFEADFVTEFTVEPKDGGSLLRVCQDGFPCDPAADEFYTACEVGWRNTFAGIQAFLGE